MGRDLAATLDVSQAIDRIVSTVLDLFRVRRSALFRFDPARKDLQCIATAPASADGRWIGRWLGAEQGLVGLAFTQGRLVWTDDLLSDSRLRHADWGLERMREEGLQAAVAVPLPAQSESLGVLMLADAPGRTFSDAELALIEAFGDQAALAVQNARLHESALRRVRHLSSLIDISRLVLATLDPDAVAQRVADSTLSLLGSMASGLYRLQPNGAELVAVAVAGAASPIFRRGLALPANAGALGLALRERQPVLSPNLLVDPRVILPAELRAAMRETAYRCVLAVPLIIQDRIVGGLAIGDREGRVFDEEEIRLVQAFADQAALALEHARLYRAAHLRQRAAESLADLGRAISQSLDANEVAQRIVDNMRALLSTQAARLFRLEPGTGNLVAMAVAGDVGPTADRPLVLPAGQGVAGLAVSRQRPVYSADPFHDPAVPYAEELRALLQRAPYRAVLAVPLLIRDRVIGALAIGDRTGRRFSEEEMLLAQAFADQAAIALENARLYEEARRQRQEAEVIAGRLRELVQSLDAIVWEADAGTGQLAFVSQRAEAILGYSLARWLTEPDFRVNVIHPEDRDRVVAASRQAVAAGQQHELEYRAIAADGRVVWLRDTVHVTRESAEGRLRLRGLTVDITERRRAEEELRRQREAVAQTERLAAMGQLLAGVAHELNNPLSVVLGHATLLRELVGPGPHAARADKIGEAAERCARIVRNFLTLARQNPPERRQVSLNQIVVEALEVVAYSLRVDDVEVVLELDPDLPLLWADPHQLHQVAVNLLSNAHHAMRQTTPPRRLTLATRVDRDRARVILDVADSGPGIPPEIGARIMEPFFTTKAPGQGTGLGLSICRGIVDAHGGVIQVSNQSPHGARFRVELPLQSPPAPAAEARPTPTAAPVRGKRILVVDDEPEIASVLAEMLMAEGHRVDTVSNGTRALAQLADQCYDLIVSDVRMPELDGPALYREVERRHPSLSQRFAFVTGDTLSADTARVLEATGVPRLSKPFVLDEVRRIVQELLARP
jgi:two-component system NtrC family sensor kinase